MEQFGGAGILPSGAVHLESPTTVTERTVDAFEVVGAANGLPVGNTAGGGGKFCRLGGVLTASSTARVDVCLMQGLEVGRRVLTLGVQHGHGGVRRGWLGFLPSTP